MAFFKGEEGGIEKISTLSPEQKKLMEQMFGFTSGKIGEGLPAWEGAFAAPMTATEQSAQDILSRYVEEQPPIADFGLGRYRQALEGMSPKETIGWYQKYIAPEEKRVLEEEYIPTFKESMVPGGALRSTGTERGIADIIGKFGTAQLGRMGEAIMAERAGARGMLPYLGEMAKLEGGMPRVEAAAQYGALPRLIEQQELAGKMAEFIRTTPELSPVLNLAMEILKTPTQAAYYRPPEKSGLLQWTEALAPIIGRKAGAFTTGAFTAA